MSDLLPDQRRHELALQIRYFAVNITAAADPLLGITFGLNSQKSTFILTAICYVPFLFFILMAIPAGKLLINHTKEEIQSTDIGFRDVISVIMRDNIYLVSLASGILYYLVYA